MCCSFHHHDQPLQVRLWIESGHHLLEGTIACAFALCRPLHHPLHEQPS